MKPASLEQHPDLPDQLQSMAAELIDPRNPWHQQFYDESDGVRPTPTWQMPDPYRGHTLFIKDETSHQVTVSGRPYDIGAFKRRGAWAAALAPLAPGELPPDILTTGSAGNHAQGVALAALILGLESEIHCPKTVSPAKLDKSRAMGANVRPYYTTVDDANVAAELERGLGEDGLVRRFIHPFDQAEVIAGQSTMVDEWLLSLEAAQADGEIDLLNDEITVIVPIGGGGLASGWAIGLDLARQQGRVGNNVRLLGAQMEDCDAMNRVLYGPGLKVGRSLFRHLDISCDGTAVRAPGRLTEVICRQSLDGIVLLSPAEVGAAMAELGKTLHKGIEPAGALAYAAAQKHMRSAPAVKNGQRSLVTCVASGANVSTETLRHFADRAATYRAQLAFTTRSEAYLNRKVAPLNELIQNGEPIGSETTFATGTSLAASPTHTFRQNPERLRQEHLLTLQ